MSLYMCVLYHISYSDLLPQLQHLYKLLVSATFKCTSIKAGNVAAPEASTRIVNCPYSLTQKSFCSPWDHPLIHKRKCSP